MTNLSYPLFVWKNHRGFAIFSLVVISALQFLVVELIPSVDVAPVIASLLNQLPERFQSFVNETFITRLTVKGAVAFGFNHPLVLALLAINAINIPNRHIAGEIETGTLELLLAYPIQRTRLFITLWMSANLLLFSLICGAWTGSLSAIAVSDNLTFDLFLKILQIGANLWLLFVLVMSYTLLISIFGKEGSKTGMLSAGLTFIFFLIYLLSPIWDAISFIKPYTIFTYYQPQKLMFDQQSFWLNAVVLTALIGICLLVSLRKFNRRDIPG